jgi:hypothetical protein
VQCEGKYLSRPAGADKPVVIRRDKAILQNNPMDQKFVSRFQWFSIYKIVHFPVRFPRGRGVVRPGYGQHLPL